MPQTLKNVPSPQSGISLSLAVRPTPPVSPLSSLVHTSSPPPSLTTHCPPLSVQPVTSPPTLPRITSVTNLTYVSNLAFSSPRHRSRAHTCPCRYSRNRGWNRLTIF